ncbi:2-Hydroxy-4-oxobutane-1 [Colletotrichum simmondsii]|uniref:2-Hydroxy-4-oxobutane-1 n=1 Tax=Colletotrichum simmondsii TaxID=703756 RepID=A0A135RNQ2_9PEZI|nr:2-Hydroxy-4-oxobutane-1 [Colletotrichum simmondsii]
MANLIALEEHYVSPLLDAKKGGGPSPDTFGPVIVEKLGDIGPARLRDMADNSVAMTVLSHSPVHPNPETCKAINDDLHSKIIHHPADFFDTPDFYPLWETAQELDVPFYLHPTFPAEEESNVNFQGPYDPEMAKALGSWGWGWHSRTGLHFLRLFAAGVFDKFPKLKIILGHMGEMLPFMLDRIIGMSARWPAPSGRERKRGLRQVWDENVWITTSGMFSLAPMACLLQETKVERIMFSVDYPFAGNGAGKEFMNKLKESGLVSEDEWEGIAWRNAKGLLRLKFEPKN